MRGEIKWEYRGVTEYPEKDFYGRFKKRHKFNVLEENTKELKKKIKKIAPKAFIYLIANTERAIDRGESSYF